MAKNELSDKEKSAVFRLVEEVLISKPQLLQRANLYIILACSLVHNNPKAFVLHKTLEALKKSDSNMQIRLEANDELGLPVPVEDFYRLVFTR